MQSIAGLCIVQYLPMMLRGWGGHGEWVLSTTSTPPVDSKGSSALPSAAFRSPERP